MATEQSAAPVHFGDLLRQHRLALGLTQEALAERAGLSKRGISDLERGARTRPQRESLHLLAEALGLSGLSRAAFVAAARRRAGNARQHSPLSPHDPFTAAPLPVPLDEFVGRERELVGITELLRGDGVRLLTLTGPGGVGKTRLAITVADDVSAHFSGGVAFVGLAHIRDASLVASAIAQGLGVRASGAESVKESLTAALGTGKTLLMLDNFEQVVDAAPLALDLLAACPQLTIMVTSRAPLRLRGELEVPVLPLDLPAAARSESPETVSRHASVRLFVARCRAVAADFALDEVTAPTVSEICWRLDGLPLAIELAAARIRMLPLTTLLARLEKRLPLLTGGARDAPDRQRTLRDTIAWSHDLLRPQEQTLFRRLAVFTGGWTLEAAEAVVGASDVEVLDGLETLMHQSLIQRVEGVAGEPRYVMLETVIGDAPGKPETSGRWNVCGADMQLSPGVCRRGRTKNAVPRSEHTARSPGGRTGEFSDRFCLSFSSWRP